MRHRYLTLFWIFLLVALVSCKKENKYPIVGKWQQIKLRVYSQSYSGVISHDTTYQVSSFNDSNYAQFNNDGTCVIGLFYPPGLYDLRSSLVQIATEKYNYSAKGNGYIMTLPTALTNPGGFIARDTASINGNTVLIHSTFDNHQFYNMSDAYYSK